MVPLDKTHLPTLLTPLVADSETFASAVSASGEVAGFSRALGVDDVGGAVDEVFDRAFTSIADFPGHARDFRLDVLRTTAAIARERSDDDNGSERAAAVLFSAFGCSADDVALITGLSPDVVAACEPRPAAQRDHRRRFRLDDPPAPGPAVTDPT